MMPKIIKLSSLMPSKACLGSAFWLQDLAVGGLTRLVSGGLWLPAEVYLRHPRTVGRTKAIDSKVDPKHDCRCPTKVRNHGSAQPLQGTEVGKLLTVSESEVTYATCVSGFREVVCRCQHMSFRVSEVKLA